jgi:transcriptional regulator with XRE-family HTH domain
MKSNFSNEYETFRKCIIDSRKKTKLTQAELANLLGKPQSYVAKYESGERRLDLIEFLLIAKALKVNPVEIIKAIEANSELLSKENE